MYYILCCIMHHWINKMVTVCVYYTIHSIIELYFILSFFY